MHLFLLPKKVTVASNLSHCLSVCLLTVLFVCFLFLFFFFYSIVVSTASILIKKNFHGSKFLVSYSKNAPLRQDSSKIVFPSPLNSFDDYFNRSVKLHEWVNSLVWLLSKGLVHLFIQCEGRYFLLYISPSLRPPHWVSLHRHWQFTRQ